MRVVWTLALGVALLAGCRGLPPAVEPVEPPGLAPPGEPYWAQDDAYLQALAVARAGAPSSTPELDAIAALASSTTPELGLAELLVPGDRPPAPLRLRPGDLVAVAVYGRPELGGEALRIGPDGQVPLALLGPLQVAGLTEVEASRAVAQRLESLCRDPQVQVRLLEGAPATASVVGRVADPGLRSLPAERALECVELIALCGGLVEDADVLRLTLLRQEGGTTRGFHFTFEELLAAAPAGRSAPLVPGDVLVVPRLPEVYAFGRVARSGAFPLRPGATVASLLLQAGGVAEGASARDLQLMRGGRSVPVVGLDEPLVRGDVVFVPQRRQVFLVGAGLRESGPIDIPGTGLTVVQAIAAVGWLTKRADLDGVEVLRYRGGQGARLAIPLREILSGEARAADYPLEPGDVIHVPETVW